MCFVPYAHVQLGHFIGMYRENRLFDTGVECGFGFITPPSNNPKV